MNDSIGIIGGADGPTAIFVTGSPAGLILALLLAAALAGGVALLFWRKHKK